jgi:hypothetical protein
MPVASCHEQASTRFDFVLHQVLSKVARAAPSTGTPHVRRSTSGSPFEPPPGLDCTQPASPARVPPTAPVILPRSVAGHRTAAAALPRAAVAVSSFSRLCRQCLARPRHRLSPVNEGCLNNVGGKRLISPDSRRNCAQQRVCEPRQPEAGDLRELQRAPPKAGGRGARRAIAATQATETAPKARSPRSLREAPHRHSQPARDAKRCNTRHPSPVQLGRPSRRRLERPRHLDPGRRPSRCGRRRKYRQHDAKRQRRHRDCDAHQRHHGGSGLCRPWLRGQGPRRRDQPLRFARGCA